MATVGARTNETLANVHDRYPRLVTVSLGVSAAIAIWVCFLLAVRVTMIDAASFGRGTVLTMMGLQLLAGLFTGVIFLARTISPLTPAVATLFFLPTAFDYVIPPARPDDPIFGEWLPPTAAVILTVLFLCAVILEIQDAGLAQALRLGPVENVS